jgi:hypothetical protein
MRPASGFPDAYFVESITARRSEVAFIDLVVEKHHRLARIEGDVLRAETRVLVDVGPPFDGLEACSFYRIPLP